MKQYLLHFDFNVTVEKARSQASISCPPWLNQIDVRPLVCFEHLVPADSRRLGRPTNDLVLQLRANLMYGALRHAAGSDNELSAIASKAWGLDKDTTERTLRSFRSSTRLPSDEKLGALSEFLPEIQDLISWPWHVLIPRWTKHESRPRTGFGLEHAWSKAERAPEAAPSGPEMFWIFVERFREALCRGTAQEMLQGSYEVLLSLPHIFTHPLVRPRAVEFVDLAYRLLSALPPMLYPPAVDQRLIFQPFLRHDELDALPNSLVDRQSWANNSFLSSRYASFVYQTMTTRDAGELVAHRRAWNFLPAVRDRNNRTEVWNAHDVLFDVYAVR